MASDPRPTSGVLCECSRNHIEGLTELADCILVETLDLICEQIESEMAG